MSEFKSTGDRNSLRRQTETMLPDKQSDLARLGDAELQNLVHELQVHKIELELQNEALQASHAALQLARQHYADLFDSAPIGYVILDELGAVVEVNATCLNLLGRRRRALMGHAFGPLVSLEDRPHYAIFRRRLMQGETPAPIEVRLEHEDGTYIPCLLVGQRQEHDAHAATSIRCAIVDYTAQHRLRESDEKIRRIIAHSTDGIAVTDTDGRIILWSPAQQRITGLAQEDAVGKYLWDVDFALSPAHLQTDDLLASLQRTTKALLQDGQPGDASLFDDDRIVDAAGNVRTIQRAKYTFPSADGHMLGSIMRDITGQKKTREDLQRRVAELGLIYRASQAFTSTLELDEVLRLVLHEVVQLLDVTGACIWLMDEDGGEFVARQWVGQSGPMGTFVDASNLTTYCDLLQCVLASGQSLIVPDLRAYVPDMRDDASDKDLATRACLLTPLKIKDKVIGVLHLIDGMPHRFAAAEVALLESLAVPASIAVENARLFEEARVASELRERQRWIHRIHDLYNQSLFSASLIAEVLPQLWDQDPAAGAQAANDLRTLLRGALAEQRAAMLELRPADLTGANLEELLEQLAAGFEGRTNIPVRTAFDGDTVLPGDVRVALYRICQEALSNVAKHANAHHVAIYLSRLPGSVTMRIADDGVGFEQETRAPEQLGLQVMQERAHQVGACLTLTSHEGRGTMVEVCWSRRVAP